MGLGDELIATGQAVAAQRRDPRPVVVVDRLGQPRWHALWAGSSRIVPTRGAPHQTVLNAPGARPYIDYTLSCAQRWSFRDFACTPGELQGIAVDPRGAGRIIIEPHIKATASPNKQWGWSNWLQLVTDSPGLPWAQVGPPDTQWLPGVERIETGRFLDACSILASARAAVLPEGGLHHAAAAVGCAAIVLFGAFITPASTGYPAHRNLFVDCPDARGWRVPHPACHEAWRRITPAMVLAHLDQLLAGPPAPIFLRPA